MALVMFSLCVQMAEGTSYGIVPFMKPEQLACVSALVGAGGNAGAVFAGFAFYKQEWNEDPVLGQDATLTPFKLHALSVVVTALMNPLYYWPKYGGMFCPPAITEGKDPDSPKADMTPGTTLVISPPEERRISLQNRRGSEEPEARPEGELQV